MPSHIAAMQGEVNEQRWNRERRGGWVVWAKRTALRSSAWHLCTPSVELVNSAPVTREFSHLYPHLETSLGSYYPPLNPEAIHMFETLKAILRFEICRSTLWQMARDLRDSLSAHTWDGKHFAVFVAFRRYSWAWRIWQSFSVCQYLCVTLSLEIFRSPYSFSKSGIDILELHLR